jgi:hypothetical protein
MCSCKSSDVTTVSKTDVSSDVSILNEKAKQDTTRVEKIQQTEEFTRIYESETIVEYDTEKQVVSKVTKKEKVTEQGKQVKTNESEDRGLSESEKVKANQSLEVNQDVKVKEEPIWGGLTKNLGKWLGIGICGILLGLMIWNGVKKKLFL